MQLYIADKKKTSCYLEYLQNGMAAVSKIVDFTIFGAFFQLLSVITPKLFEIGN